MRPAEGLENCQAEGGGSAQPATSILACCTWSMQRQKSTMKARTATYSSSRFAFSSSAALHACAAGGHPSEYTS